jgi:spermidine/putrescine transport system substrate-binding protein
MDAKRRKLVGGLGAAGGMAMLGMPASVAAQSVTIQGMLNSLLLPEPLRPMVAQQADVRVELAPYTSVTDVVARLLAPGGTSRFDLMGTLTNVVRGPGLGPKAGDEKLRALNMAAIPNAQGILQSFRRDIISRDGKTYGLPIAWGYESVIYNADRVPTGDPLTESWRLLFDDKYKGRIAWRDDAHGMIMTGGFALGHKDPVKLAGKDLAEVGKFLADRKKNIRTMWTKFGEAVGLMASGEVWAMYGWVSMRANLRKQGLKALNNWPRESLLTWSFAAIVPKDAAQAAAAERVINVMLSDEYGRRLIENTNYPSTSEKAARSFSKEDWADRGLNIDERGIPLYGFDLPPNMNEWVETWNKVRVA